MKRLLILGALALGCDNPALLANIDTYTCAYLPGVIDCSTQEVHDKAVRLLEHGIVSAEATCACTMTNPVTSQVSFFGGVTVRKLLDDSCLISVGGDLRSFSPRGEPCAAAQLPYSFDDGLFTVDLNGMPENRYSAPIETCCTGFGFEAFGVE